MDLIHVAETQCLTRTLRQLGIVVQQAAAAFEGLSQQVTQHVERSSCFSTCAPASSSMLKASCREMPLTSAATL